jgi:ferredoxin
MTCPSRVTAGKVDQAGSMLSDDVEEKGFALLCCAVPLEEGVVIKTVTEEELLDEQLCA